MFELTGIMLAFLGMMFFGIGDSLFEIPARKYKEKVILFYQFSFMALLAGLLFLVEIENIQIITNFSWTILYALFAGIFDVCALFFLIKSLKNEKLGLSIAVASAYPIVVTVFSILFLGEHLNKIQVFSIFAIISGIFLISFTSLNFRKIVFNKNLRFAFISLFFWATDVILLKFSANNYSEIESTILLNFGGFVAIIIFSVFFVRKVELKKIEGKSIFITFVIAVLFSVGAYFLNSALRIIDAGLVSAILSSSAMITTLIGVIFYKERFKLHQYLGIALIVMSLFCLNFFS
jgi:drug/metabolite transporter (DMT)-like permease